MFVSDFIDEGLTRPVVYILEEGNIPVPCDILARRKIFSTAWQLLKQWKQECLRYFYYS